jgi:hypothetical protein
VRRPGLLAAGLAAAIAAASVLLAPGAGAASSPSACDLLRPAELSKALGVRVQVLAATDPTSCAWRDANAESPTYVFLVLSPPPTQTFDDIRGPGQRSPEVRLVPGLGDFAVTDLSGTRRPDQRSASIAVVSQTANGFKLDIDSDTIHLTHARLVRLGKQAFIRLTAVGT